MKKTNSGRIDSKIGKIRPKIVLLKYRSEINITRNERDFVESCRKRCSKQHTENPTPSLLLFVISTKNVFKQKLCLTGFPKKYCVLYCFCIGHRNVINWGGVKIVLTNKISLLLFLFSLHGILGTE